MGNALKFAQPEGRVTVGADIQDGQLTIQVSDTGIGIPSDAISHLFTEFYQVDRTSRDHTGGAGLGLYISTLLVEAHGGRIWAESREGDGSTFGFTHPLGDNGHAE